MKIKKCWLILCTIFWVLNLANMVESSPTPKTKKLSSKRHSHRLKQMKQLREELDRAILKQQTDHIHLNNIKSNLEKLQNTFDYVHHETQEELSTLTEDVKDFKRTSRILDSSRRDLSRIRTPEVAVATNLESSTFNVGIEAYEALRNDFLHLKSEMEYLKLKCQSTSSEGDALREESSMSWLLQVVPDLQKSVRDIQESTNLLQEMHNKKDLDLKIGALSSDMSSIQTSLVKLTTRIEASGAIAESLTQELAENTAKMHQIQTKTAITEEKLEEQTETVDDLLRSLPDGFLQKISSKRKSFSLASKMRPMVETQVNNANFLEKFDKLELKTSSIDFALMTLQKKLLLKETETLRKEDSDKGTLSDRLEEVEDELAKIKHSSTSLIQIVAEAERKDTQSDAKMQLIMDQLQSKLERERQDRKTSDDAEVNDQKELRLEEHTDIYEFRRILTSLSNRISKVEKTSITSSIDSDDDDKNDEETHLTSLSSSCDSECLSMLRNELNSTHERLTTLENFFQEGLVKKRRHRHRHDIED